MSTSSSISPRPETPPLSDFPDYSILEAIGRASHCALAKAPAIGSLGWYMNMRDSGLSDDEIDELEKGTYSSPSSESDPDSFVVNIAPPPPPIKRVSWHLPTSVGEDDVEVRNLIDEFNAMSWPSPDETYSRSPEVTFAPATSAEVTLRAALNAAMDEWNAEIDHCHPNRLFTNVENEIRELKMMRYRHLISTATSLLIDTFGCHVCRDRRSYRGACANCLDTAVTAPKSPKEDAFVIPISKLKHQ